MADYGKKSGSGFDIDKIMKFCKDNVKYISAGVLVVALVIVLAVSTMNKSGNKDAADHKAVAEEEVKTDAPEEEGNNEAPQEKDEEDKDEYPEITELMSTYYNSYATGDLDKLSGIARKLTDMEKDYIKMMNEYVESYDNVSCTVTDGAKEGTYIAAVTYDMKFAGVDETLPGMNIFYIQTNKKGELYINNRYSSFNVEMGEQETKKKINKLIKEFENSDTVKDLLADVQEEYDSKVKADKGLQDKLNEVAEAIANWKDTYTPSEDNGEEEPAEEPAQPEEPAQEEQPEENTDEQQPEENTDEQPEENNDEQQPEDNSDDSGDDGGSSGLNYVPEGKVLTASQGYNVRTSMSESAEVIGTTAVGDSITVILSYAEGWTKVEWNGNTGYIRTDLLLNN